MDIRAFRGPCGTYNVRANEPNLRPNERNFGKPVKTISCLVSFLDDTHHDFKVDKRAKGQVLLDMVSEYLIDLKEKDFFSLKYVPCESQIQTNSAVSFFKTTFNSNSPSSSASLSSATTNNNGSLDYSTCQYNEQMEHWLDPRQTICKQIKSTPPHTFKFRVKFYVSDPSKLRDDYTRYLFFLQLRRDIWAKRLIVSESNAIRLGSYALQSELGDYNQDKPKKEYEFKIIPDQRESMTREIVELYKKHAGQTQADAEYNFLDIARKIECYGIEFYNAKDVAKVDLQVGVSSNGIVIFRNGLQSSTFSWANIIKIMFKRKLFSIQLRRKEGETCDNVVCFNLLTNQQCKSFWLSCAAHHSFFRLQSPRTPPKKFFSFLNFGSKFQYNGKTEYQTLEESKKRSSTHFSRTPSKYARQTVPVGRLFREEQSSIDCCGRAFNQEKPYDMHDMHDNIESYRMNQTNNDDFTMTSCKPAYRPNSITLRSFSYIDEKKSEAMSSAKKNASESSKLMTADNSIYTNGNCSLNKKSKLPGGLSLDFPDAKSKNATVKSDSFAKVLAKKTNASTKHLVRISETIKERFYNGSSKTARYKNVPEVESRNTSPMSLEIASYGYCNVKTVKMFVGKDGKYGFKVDGGDRKDRCLGYCHIISKITPNSPAEKCQPKLEKGDKVLRINGEMVDSMTHSEVVALIQSIQTSKSSELTLEIQSAVISSESSSVTSSPSKRYSNPSPVSTSSTDSNSLESSIDALKRSLESGDILEEFKALPRKKEAETFEDSKMQENIHKNRYRDILPYDSTRVILSDSMTGDYINASFVNMAIPNTPTLNLNKYIATQGPLNSTCEDFWQMIWEQSCSLIIMVTTLMEAGRVKCSKYWPDEKSEVRYGQLSISTLHEKTKKATIDRRIQVTDVKSGNKRILTQVQYKSWPDHEVPEDCSDFLKLIYRVRKHRQTHPEEPVVVHCSAGIGRTGVLILMETAICLMESGQPIYPLLILDDMRNQRAMLIQTTSQFQFVLDAICRVYYNQELGKRSKKHLR